MEALIRLTWGAPPDRVLLCNARWALSRASAGRRLLWADILHFLAPVADREAALELRRLQDIDIALVRASADHVGRWTIAAILADWPGYCEASQAMRGRMISAMEAEKQILYPLLRSMGRPGPARDSAAMAPQTIMNHSSRAWPDRRAS